MAGSSLENFRGDHHEDVYMFLRRVELAAVTINRDEDAYKARMVGLLLEGQAREWYDDVLPNEAKGNWAHLCEALKQRFGKMDNAKDLWRELSRLLQGEEEDIATYINRFEACWRRIMRALGEHQVPPDFLKKDKFMCLLHESIRGRVELKDPNTYADAVRIATEQ